MSIGSSLSAYELAERLQKNDSTREAGWLRALILGISLVFFVTCLLLPLILVFVEAFRHGWQTYLNALVDQETWSAVKLTLLTAAVAVPLNVIFGLAAAWSIAKFQFRGKALLTTLIDLPFSVSPVVAGLMLVLVFGSRGWLGGWLSDIDFKVIYTPLGIILATVFITVPFVARELIPLMEAQGTEEEEAAIVLGANGWQTFWHVTLPNIKWGLLYGVILCNARAMGEFGAVSVVSGHIRGETNTLPLQVEILYNEYSFSAAFAVASLLAFLALITLLIKTWVDGRASKDANAN